ncbi:3'-5' exonuclease [Myroides injenensis]|uniref:3'-5' exonuclease n=1 Tax=Myroides injenensis TaxID=1183151 RepID=UPI0002897B6A|nr:ribonuclease H-like domain-containing protein [Myroides injenensis]
MVLESIQLENILFLDIETVPATESFEDLDSETQMLFEGKTSYQRKDEISAKEFYVESGDIWAEFGKIVCISVGYFSFKNGIRQFRTTSFWGDEKELLQSFANLLDSYFSRPQHVLCGHNAKEFDFPYIARRMLVNEVRLPAKLNLMGKKPWEVLHLDTMELWKFGDFKNFTSLKLLTKILRIPSPKDDIDGSEVRKVYYEDNDINRIVTYCEKDVLAVAQIILKFKREPLLTEEEILSV